MLIRYSVTRKNDKKLVLSLIGRKVWAALLAFPEAVGWSRPGLFTFLATMVLNNGVTN